MRLMINNVYPGKRWIDLGDELSFYWNAGIPHGIQGMFVCMLVSKQNPLRTLLRSTDKTEKIQRQTEDSSCAQWG